VASILVKLAGSARANAKLTALTAALANPQPLYATIGRVLVNRVRLCFKLGIDPWGSPWAALKIRKGQPLRDTGRLQRSITSQADGTGVTVGTNVFYAPTHQFGATIYPKTAKRLVFPGPGGRMIFAKKVVVPARPFLPLRRSGGTVALPPDWSVLATDAIKRYLKGAVTKVEA
jgi:phage virion morphogenesis protein